MGSLVGHNLSYTWHSIHTSQVMVKKGKRCRLGDGRNTNVWKNSWFRSTNISYIATPTIDSLENLMMSCLVNPTKVSWNETLIHDLFLLQDVTRIMQMPIYVLEGINVIL